MNANLTAETPLRRMPRFQLDSLCGQIDLGRARGPRQGGAGRGAA